MEIRWTVIDKRPEVGDTVLGRRSGQFLPATVVRVLPFGFGQPGPKIVCERKGEERTFWPDEVEVIEVEGIEDVYENKARGHDDDAILDALEQD